MKQVRWRRTNTVCFHSFVEYKAWTNNLRISWGMHSKLQPFPKSSFSFSFYQTSWCSAHMPNFLVSQEFVETLYVFSHFQDLPIKFLFGPLFPSPQPANLVLQKAAGFPWSSVLSPILSASRAVGFYLPTNWFIPR